MLFLDKETFFNQQQLPNKSFYYSYNGQNYEMDLEYVIERLDRSEGKSLFLMNALNATNDFIVNVYLQDIADELIQSYARRKLQDEIENSLFLKKESYRFQLTKEDGTEVDYIAYVDEEGSNHVDKVDEVGMYAGWARLGDFQDYLVALLKRHRFDCKRIEEPKSDGD